MDEICKVWTRSFFRNVKYHKKEDGEKDWVISHHEEGWWAPKKWEFYWVWSKIDGSLRLYKLLYEPTVVTGRGRVRGLVGSELPQQKHKKRCKEHVIYKWRRDRTCSNRFFGVVATQICFSNSPQSLEFHDPILTHIFQMGWNHQLVNSFCLPVFVCLFKM